MKIVHIITRLIIGGAQENTLLSCEGQHKAGHDVTLITGPAIGPEGSLLPRAMAGGYRVIVLDDFRRAIAGRDVRVFHQLVRELRALKPDIVHTHSSKGGILGRWAAKRAGCRGVVHTIHGLAFTASTHALVNGLYKALEWQTAPLANRIVCVADAMKQQSLAAHIGIPSQYVTVYSGMDVQPFLHPAVGREQVRKSLGLDDSHVVVGTIARLFDLKGHDDLLDLAPHLCQQFPQLRFLWVGDGSLRTKFESRMQQMQLRDRFILTGMVQPHEVPAFTNAMDILVHPSRREGLARALPQAQLAAVPPITYDIDGNREALLHDVNGILIKPFDCGQLGKAISRLAGDAFLRSRMGQAGREFALGRFDTNVMVDRLQAVYESVLAEMS